MSAPGRLLCPHGLPAHYMFGSAALGADCEQCRFSKAFEDMTAALKGGRLDAVTLVGLSAHRALSPYQAHTLRELRNVRDTWKSIEKPIKGCDRQRCTLVRAVDALLEAFAVGGES